MQKRACHLLALETSGRTASIALGVCDDPTHVTVVATASLSGAMRHASELPPTIEDVLNRAGWKAAALTHVFVSVGPGSFTGIRIGVTTARTLGWSIGARIVAVPTVDGLALNALDADPVPEHVAVVLDAKRSQVYAAAYRIADGTCIRVADPCLADPESFLASCPRPLAVLGEGVAYHREAVEASGARVLDEDLSVGRAEQVLRVGADLMTAGRFTSPGDLIPLYIRRPEAEEKWERRHGEGYRVPQRPWPREGAGGGIDE